MGPTTPGSPLATVTVAEGDRHIQVTIESGDALTTPGDVLLVKYAQGSYGLDREVVKRLRESGSDVGQLPLPGRSLTIKVAGIAKTDHVVFMGTPPLSRFGYDAVRTWAREGLAAASNAPGRAATVVTTVHGLEIGGVAFDEQLTLESQLQGFRDALRFDQGTASLTNVRIVERDTARARRLADQLPVAARPEVDTGDVDDSRLSPTVSAARTRLSPTGVVTAGELASSIQQLHPEYANASFGNVRIDPDLGTTRTVDDWLKLVRGLYDPADVSTSDRDLLSGRLLVAGLAMLDEPLRRTLDRDGVLSALLMEMEVRPRDPSLRQDVPWTPDDPRSRADDLGRRLVARSLAEQLTSFDDDHRGYSFALLIDGRWGAGKSTLLRLLVDELEQARAKRQLKPACIVSFDAWRQSRAGPPWLRLMTGLRAQLIADGYLRGPTRIVERWRRLGVAAQVAVVVFAAVAAALLALWASGALPVDSAAAQITAVAAFVAALATASTAVGRALGSDSQRRARSFLDSSPEPMIQLAEHFHWLRCRSQAPVMFLIDDLDRCDQDYVVELLDNVQKLVRDEGADSGKPPTLYVVVAADERWLRSAYQVKHASFVDAIGEPGRPLGSLFLDKFFQVRVPVPELSPRLQQRFLQGLLGSVGGGGTHSMQTGELRARIRDASTNDEVLEVLRSTDPLQRIEVAEAALDRLSSSHGSRAPESRHALERFAPLLEPNPRSVRRFLIAFDVLRAARLGEGNPVATEPLALWTIVTVRWPMLAEFLADDPERVKLFGAPKDQLDLRVQDALRDLLVAPTDELRQVFNHAVGGPLTSDVIRQCAGLA